MRTVVPASSELDHTLVDERDRVRGLDTAARHPLAERIRAAFDAAELADRIDHTATAPPEDR
ncbi:hypothetical protein [Nocardia inohanensis]|uniref:hypothetical protein n=1 Tax=Nocardia inohanensis TaxID=209246 RepID=UPI0008296E07|nr:hypothetical protein [Nocardia inohanensis]